MDLFFPSLKHSSILLELGLIGSRTTISLFGFPSWYARSRVTFHSESLVVLVVLVVPAVLAVLAGMESMIIISK